MVNHERRFRNFFYTIYAIENTVTNTIDALSAWRVMGRLGETVPSNRFLVF